MTVTTMMHGGGDDDTWQQRTAFYEIHISEFIKGNQGLSFVTNEEKPLTFRPHVLFSTKICSTFRVTFQWCPGPSRTGGNDRSSVWRRPYSHLPPQSGNFPWLAVQQGRIWIPRAGPEGTSGRGHLGTGWAHLQGLGRKFALLTPPPSETKVSRVTCG